MNPLDQLLCSLSEIAALAVFGSGVAAGFVLAAIVTVVGSALRGKP